MREFQIVQRTLEKVEMLLVLGQPLTEKERSEIFDVLVERFGDDFHLIISIHETITRTRAVKLRAFISELPRAG